jgi:hypothetical protein
VTFTVLEHHLAPRQRGAPDRGSTTSKSHDKWAIVADRLRLKRSAIVDLAPFPEGR